MIRSFRGKDPEALWQRRYVKKFSPELSRAVYSKLALINAAGSINDQWPICFTWSASGAANVELVDYHEEGGGPMADFAPTQARFF